jgi:hypothetical protein
MELVAMPAPKESSGPAGRLTHSPQRLLSCPPAQLVPTCREHQASRIVHKIKAGIPKLKSNLTDEEITLANTAFNCWPLHDYFRTKRNRKK